MKIKIVVCGTDSDLTLDDGYGSGSVPDQKKFKEAIRLYEETVATAQSERGAHKAPWKQTCRLMEKPQPTEAERALIRKPFEILPVCDELEKRAAHPLELH